MNPPVGLRCARGRRHSRQKIQNGACKYVVLVARYHMARICDIDKLGMRNNFGELPRRFDRHEVAVAAPDKERRYFQGTCRHLEAFGFAAALRLLCAGDETWIPMPVVAAVFPEAKVLRQSAQVFGARPTGHVAREDRKSTRLNSSH